MRSKTKILKEIIGDLRSLCYENKVELSLINYKIAGIIALGQLSLVLLGIMLSIIGWKPWGDLIGIIAFGSVLTNMTWFVLTKKETKVY